MGAANRLDACDADVREYLVRIAGAYRTHLGSALRAVWVVGSFAFGCYNRALSDLDLLVVVDGPVPATALRALARDCVALTDERPTPGDQETSVVPRAALSPLMHPTPHVFQYSADWTEKYRSAGFRPYDGKADPDIVAHAAVALHCGTTLFGEEPAAVLGHVPWSAFRSALLEDLRWILGDDHLVRAPLYGVLNACRILGTLAGGPGTVWSKLEGAEWALRHFPAGQRPLVAKARDAYVSTAPVSPDALRTAGLTWDAALLAAFVDHVRGETAGL